MRITKHLSDSRILERVTSMCTRVCVHVCTLAILLLSATSLVSCTQTDWSQDEFPDPTVDIALCGNKQRSWVCDPNNLVTRSQADKLIAQTLDVYNEIRVPTPYCGKCKNCSQPIIALALVYRVKNWSGRYPRTKEDTLEAVQEFSFYLLNKSWKFGGSCGNDAVIVLSKRDRKLWTAVGDTAKVRLTDQCVQHVFDTHKEHFSAGDYYEGLRLVLNDYKDILSKDEAKCTTTNLGLILGLSIGIPCGLLLLCLFCCCLCKGSRGGGGSSSSHNHFWDSWGGDGGGGSGGGGGWGGGGGDF